MWYVWTRRVIGTIRRQLCRQQGVALIEGPAVPDHLNPGVENPPEVQRSAASR